MKWQMLDGSFHELTRVPTSYRDPNTVVRIYGEPWVIYSHVYHSCDEDCGDDSGNNWFLFGGHYLQQFIDLKFWQVVIDDQPDEKVFAARDLIQAQYDQKQLSQEADELADADDDTIWTEMDRWAGA